MPTKASMPWASMARISSSSKLADSSQAFKHTKRTCRPAIPLRWLSSATANSALANAEGDQIPAAPSCAMHKPIAMRRASVGNASDRCACQLRTFWVDACMKSVHPFPDIDHSNVCPMVPMPIVSPATQQRMHQCTTKMLSLEEKFIRLAEIPQNVSRIYA
jgi:hypothetical protein